MNDNVINITAVLRDELAANDKPDLVDPAAVPLRYSTAKLIAQSPLHYWYATQQGSFEETLSTRLGSGTHAILFGTPYVTWHGRRASKAWEAFEEEHSGEVILNQTEYTRAVTMAAAIRSHPIAYRLLFTDTVIEQQINWEWQGRSWRSTPDAASRTACVDLKCLRSAEPDKVKWQSRNMAYHVQAAIYRRALNSTGKHNIKDNYLIVVENRAPHPVTVLRFTESAIEAGDRTAAGWLEQVLACEAQGFYPGYAQTIVDLELPMTDFIFDDDQDSEEEMEIDL